MTPPDLPPNLTVNPPPARQYTRHPPLELDQLDPEPTVQLQRWLDEATALPMFEPTAMTLATVDAQGRPSARIVLFKGFHEHGLSFYTNYESRKGQEMAANPQVSLVFWWDRLERSVRIEGRVARLSHAHSEAYFHTRPHRSQVGALTSQQSRVLASRAELDQRYADNLAHYDGKTVPLPDYWGGYLVTPDCYEFWQGAHGRLHDRFRYRGGHGNWTIDRLEP